MRKVLIIAYFWPYRNGSGRVIGLARYLPEFGWQPIILTAPLKKRPPSEFRVIETDFRCFLGFWVKLFGFNHKRDIGDQFKEKIERKSSKIKSFLRTIYWLIQEIAAYPDENKGWKLFAIKDASHLLSTENIDALISIWPTTSHIIVKELKEKYKIPWIADLPDPWSQNHDYHYSFIRKIIDRKLEKKTLASADIITTVTKPWAEGLKKLHQGKKVFAISHGFDPFTLLDKETKLTSEFTITYTGQIYHKRQDPQKLLIAVKELINEKKIDKNRIKIRFYGPIKSWLTDQIKDMGLEKIAKQYGFVSKETSLKKQRESQILLLFNWEDKKEKGVCPLKIYEYLASQRPILATGGYGRNVVEKILFKTKAGVCAPKLSDIKRKIMNFYSKYQDKNKISFSGDIEEIKKFSHREMAKKFADILEKIKK